MNNNIQQPSLTPESKGYATLKRHDPVTKRHSVTSQKTRTLKNAATKPSKTGQTFLSFGLY